MSALKPTGCERLVSENEDLGLLMRTKTIYAFILLVIGAVIYYIVIQIVLWMGLNTNLLKLLSALIVAVFLAVPYWKAKAGQRGGRAHA